MKRIIVLGFLLFIGAAGWQIGSNLDSNAVSMALGIFFGALAGLPTALLIMAASRSRPEPRSVEHASRSRGRAAPMVPYAGQPYGGYPPQPPVIVVAGAPNQGQAMASQQMAGPMHYTSSGSFNAPLGFAPPAPQRQFRMIGEPEQRVDEW